MSFDFQLIDGDIKIKSDGQVRTVTGIEKLKQDIVKIIVTPIGSSILHRWYGSSIDETVIGRPSNDGLKFEEIRTSIDESLDRLKKLQLAQASGQNVTQSEIINFVESVIVQRSIYDPRQINAIVSVITKDFSRVEEEFSVS